MTQANLVFLFNDKDQILLCMKKRDFGKGKWNGAGGKARPDETMEQAALRELEEETGIKLPKDLIRNHGVLHFFYKARPEWDQDVHIFTSRGFSGDYEETEEMQPEWFDLDKIPFSQMWEDDAIWLPNIISGEEIEYEFIFGMDGKIESYERKK